MKFLPLVLKHLRQTWVRTGSTVVAMALCVFLFCVLQSVLAGFNRVIEGRNPRKLIVRNAVSIMLGLPFAHATEIEKVPGVKRVAIMTMFGGMLPARKEAKADAGESGTDWTSVFQSAAVDAEAYFAMSPELVVAPDQFGEFMKDKQGCVVGRQLAEKFGWKIGDRFHLESILGSLRKRSGPFEFVVRGFIDNDPVNYPGTDTSFMLFHFQYLSEGLGGMRGTGTYAVEIDDPDRAGEIAGAIDALFENSSFATHTESEKAFVAGLISMAGDLGALLNAIGLAVSFTILLVTANTMSMAVRERRTEVAVLKTLGFTSAQVMVLVVSEALLLGALGGALGVGGAQWALWALNRMQGTTVLGLPAVVLRPSVALMGFGVALLLGLGAGLLPAWSAYRARITEMLRVV